MLVHMMLEAAKMRVLAVGGGAIAARKARALLAGGAEITLLAPGRQEAAWQGIECRWLAEPYTDDFPLGGYQLVIAATNQSELNRRLAERCRELNILCNCASEPAAGGVVLPGVVQGGIFSVAVASGGRLPELTKKFKTELAAFLAAYEQKFDAAQDADWLDFLAGLRRQITRQYAGQPEAKRALLAKLAELAEHKVEFIGGRNDGECDYDPATALDWLAREQAGAGADPAGGGSAGSGQPWAAMRNQGD